METLLARAAIFLLYCYLSKNNSGFRHFSHHLQLKHSKDHLSHGGKSYRWKKKSQIVWQKFRFNKLKSDLVSGFSPVVSFSGVVQSRMKG